MRTRSKTDARAVHAGPDSPQRRELLAAGAALATLSLGALPRPAAAQATPQAEPSPARIALLIGNRDYPDNQDLPPMHTNVERMRLALEALGFRVTALRDQGRDDAIRAVEAFGAQMQALPPSGTSLFYFCGHGMQIDAENFLLPSGIFPRFRPIAESRDLYVALQRNVLEPWPARPAGQAITVIDACRASPKPLADVKDDGLNQVRVREGEIVVFSTSAGKPALSPINPDRMTFFTDELVRQLERQAAAPEELTFRELFRSVGREVTRTMLEHRLEDIRELAQVPYVADNVRLPVRVSLRAPAPVVASSPSAPVEDPAVEERAYAAIAEALWPAEAARRARAFVARYPQSRYRTAATVAAEGAAESARRLREGQAALFQRDFVPRPDLGDGFNEDLRRATSGDKEAAARVGQQLLDRGGGRAGRSYVAWMQFSAELGNGVAAYDLSRYFGDVGQASLAGQWETRARELGYRVPPRLRIYR